MPPAIGLNTWINSLGNQIKALLLAAGLGTRLKPLTDEWPKCLMPIKGRPLLEYWLCYLQKIHITDVVVNTHYLSEHVESFVRRSAFSSQVTLSHENDILGTAGTVRKNAHLFKGDTMLLVHADNWTCCNLADFVHYHENKRPSESLITMMTFVCPEPTSCGIVEVDDQGVVVGFHEKVDNPPGNLANAAIYLIEPEVVQWIEERPNVTDFSTEVLPHFMGRIVTWRNEGIHKDIGTIKMLKEAQSDQCNECILETESPWQKAFQHHKIHTLIK